ncbi:6720_t:CDS:2, partial [Cetraspora pellucida]
MPRTPSPRSDYSRRHILRSEYREKDAYSRDRELPSDTYRDLDRPMEDPYYERRRSRSPTGRDRDREKYDRRERRSRSPLRDRDRDRYRERDRKERRRTPERLGRYRSRSRSPGGRRERGLSPYGSERDRRDDRYDRRIKSRSRSPRKEDTGNALGEPSNNPANNLNPDDDPEKAMMMLMGMSGFSTTKGKKVPGNQTSAVSIKKQRQYRQYMNRRGGFN